MTKVFYEKVGRKYVPVRVHDQKWIDGFPAGNHLVMCYPGGQSRRYNIDPNYAAMIAAGRVAEEVITDAIIQATDIKPTRSPLTEGQLKAWQNLAKEFGEEKHALQWPSAREAAGKAVEAMMQEAEKLLTVPAVKSAFEHFLFVAELTKEHKND
jgi:hypothetical protein